MTHKRFTSILNELGLSLAEFSSLMGQDRRTIGRWASGERSVPPSVAIILNLMIQGYIEPEDIRKVMA